jgi:hypothetical protein
MDSLKTHDPENASSVGTLRNLKDLITSTKFNDDPNNANMLRSCGSDMDNGSHEPCWVIEL